MAKKRGAFTLIELLIVIAIIGILATLVIINVNSARAKSRDTRRKTDMKAISTGVEVYYDSSSAYPKDADSLDSALTPKYLVEIPTDSKYKDANGSPIKYAYKFDAGADGYAIGDLMEIDEYTPATKDGETGAANTCRIGTNALGVAGLVLSGYQNPDSEANPDTPINKTLCNR